MYLYQAFLPETVFTMVARGVITKLCVRGGSDETELFENDEKEKNSR